jgi:LPS sulfotransferase NodH
MKKAYAMVVRFWKGSPAERQLEIARKLYDNPARKSRVVGFKTKVRDIEAPLEMKEILESRQVRLIVMERKNFVKKAVAYIYAFRLYAKTGCWNLFDEKDRLSAQHISFAEFDQMLKRMIYEHRTLHAYADFLDVPKLTLEYADLLRDKEGWFQSIFDFLGVKPGQLNSAMLPNEPDDLRQAVSNFEELKLYYAGTEFEPMFNEVV